MKTKIPGGDDSPNLPRLRRPNRGTIPLVAIKSLHDSLAIKLLCVGLVVLALALGGATELWEQAIILGALGLLMLVAPPAQSSSSSSSLLLVALMLLSLTAFLPASWGPPALWRIMVEDQARLALPATRTPQPLLTLQACALLSGGLLWTAFVMGFEWQRKDRLAALRVLVAAVSVLAAAAAVSFLEHWPVPFWTQEQNRGWFPNRNQTADVLAICGILNYALFIDRVSKGFRLGYLWILSLGAIVTELVIDTSRAGILLFFGGVLLWHLWPTPRGHRRQSPAGFGWPQFWFLHGRNSLQWSALGLALVFLLASLFLIFGGKAAERFKGNFAAATPAASGAPAAPVAPDGPHVFDYRLLIQQDALKFSFDQPLVGVGLGNFAALFPIYRDASVAKNQALHPESDWLWAACELGWPAPLIFLGGILWWLTRSLPFRIEPGETLRRAFVVAVIMYILHGFVDVSSHRVGSAFLALLLASMARRERPATTEQRWPVTPLLFRAAGLWLLLVAGWWYASIAGEAVPPTTVTLARLKQQTLDATNGTDFAQVRELAGAGLAIAPLDWQLHFQRGFAGAWDGRHLNETIADFQAARALNPHWMQLYLDEGETWRGVGDPDRALDAWKAALRHAGDEAPALYAKLLSLAHENPPLADGLREFAAHKIDWLLSYLPNASSDEIDKSIAEVLSTDPTLETLSPEQRKDFFPFWWKSGNQDELLMQLLAHPDWLTQAWPELAQSQADVHGYENACRTILHYGEAPTLPPISSNQTIADMEHEFYVQPDLTTGLQLYQAYLAQNRSDDALLAVQTMEKVAGAHPYLFYLEGQLYAQKGKWQSAWEAWKKYYHF